MVKTSVARKKNKKTSSDQTIVVSMEHVNKWFGQFHVLRDINLRVVKGERIVNMWTIGFWQVDTYQVSKPAGKTPGWGHKRSRH